MLDLVGRVFILVSYSPGVIIGKRGFLQEEKEKGIVLVFNRRMNFEWGADGISAKLVFGAVTHQCFIPLKEIISIFSPELSAHFSVSATSSSSGEEVLPEKLISESADKQAKPAGDNVVRIDFNKKK